MTVQELLNKLNKLNIDRTELGNCIVYIESDDQEAVPATTLTVKIFGGDKLKVILEQNASDE